MSFFEQIGTKLGGEVKSAKDNISGMISSNTNAKDDAIKDSVAERDSYEIASDTNLGNFENDVVNLIADYNKDLTAKYDELVAGIDNATIDGIEELRKEFSAQDQTLDTNIAAFYSGSNTSISNHIAAAGTYAEYVAAYNTAVGGGAV